MAFSSIAVTSVAPIDGLGFQAMLRREKSSTSRPSSVPCVSCNVDAARQFFDQ
jgi:hypothetical protein